MVASLRFVMPRAWERAFPLAVIPTKRSAWRNPLRRQCGQLKDCISLIPAMNCGDCIVFGD